MKYLLQLEQLGLFALSLFLFIEGDFKLWIYLLLLLTPDLSMLGYLFGNKVGAITYNIVHHQAIAILVFILGYSFKLEFIAIYGLIMLGHSSLDRVLGFGLKTYKGFKETHLGRI